MEIELKFPRLYTFLQKLHAPSRQWYIHETNADDEQRFGMTPVPSLPKDDIDKVDKSQKKKSTGGE